MAGSPQSERSASPRAGVPRLTRSVFTDLGVWMIGLGALIGVAFPFFVLPLGVDRADALSPGFFAATVAAGLALGWINFLICRGLLGNSAKLLSRRTRTVANEIELATATGDWSSYDAVATRLPTDSDDELGESARAFNRLIDAIERLPTVEAELEVTRAQARTDELTGLGNRRHFYLASEAYFEHACAAGIKAALLLIDLDRFKEINDTLGHHVGDELLRQLGRRLEQALPQSRMLARVGGDEFVALLPAPMDADRAVAAAEELLEVLDRPFSLDGLLVHMRASIGITICPDHGEDRATLLRHADIAMYRAKTAGGGIEVYARGEDEHSLDRVVLAGELRAAMDRGELVLHYQPKADLNSGNVSSVEALVRWEHPTRGLLPPVDFLALAEQHGLMRRVTQQVLELALHQAATWQREGRPLRVAVNLAAANLLDVRFPEDVAILLAGSGVAPELLQLEITEDTIMVDPVRVLDVLARLGEIGVTLSLDDFGTGYSSLAYLKRLPVQELKIDRSFVSDMSESRDDAVIVRSTVELARNLGLHVVAEGVETEQVWDQLARFGCHSAQGFFLSRPLPPSELTAWLDQRIDGAAAHAPTVTEADA